MDVEWLRSKKEKAEDEILEIINKLERETGMKVAEVFQTWCHMSDGSALTSNVNIELRC